MNRSFAVTTIVAIVTLLSITLFVWTGVHSLWYSPDSEIPPPQGTSLTAATSSQPARLVIPSLNIDASVQDVGLTAQGAMGTPDNFTDVAWYKYGPTPGSIGSAVIDGHVDNGLSLAGVFKHLSDIKLGDSVYVIAKDGTQLRFVVINIELYPYQNAPSNLIFGQHDTARLNLITCEGMWVAGGRTYDHRIVVYTELTGA